MIAAGAYLAAMASGDPTMASNYPSRWSIPSAGSFSSDPLGPPQQPGPSPGGPDGLPEPSSGPYPPVPAGCRYCFAAEGAGSGGGEPSTPSSRMTVYGSVHGISQAGGIGDGTASGSQSAFMAGMGAGAAAYFAFRSPAALWTVRAIIVYVPRVGARLVPVLGYVLLAADAGMYLYDHRDAIGAIMSADGSAEQQAQEALGASSPEVKPSDVVGKTPGEIDQLATDAGLKPKGPDPQNGKGAYVDPVTGEQRVLVHGDHAHVNDAAGNRLDINGNVVPSNSPAAHLPIKVGP